MPSRRCRAWSARSLKQLIRGHWSAALQGLLKDSPEVIRVAGIRVVRERDSNLIARLNGSPDLRATDRPKGKTCLVQCPFPHGEPRYSDHVPVGTPASVLPPPAGTTLG